MSVPEHDSAPAVKRSVLSKVLGGIVLLATAVVALLIADAVLSPRGTPWEITWQQETEELYGGMEWFELEFGEYPPNFDDMDRVAQFVERTFPQYKAGTSAPYPEGLDAAQALVFWLSGISKDPADPFAPDAKERHMFYEFMPHRLRDGRYYMSSDPDSQPFIYFAHTSYSSEEYNGFRPYIRAQSGRTKEYYSPETRQIIAAGPDNRFGHGGLVAEICEADRDNLVSFDYRPVGEIRVEE